jgi:L-alanine-DL-glutamate epimerase-like enolase superfamily enzyme
MTPEPKQEEEATPRTDLFFKQGCGYQQITPANLARQLERELNAALRELEQLREKLDPSLWTVVDHSSAWTLEEALEMHRRKNEALEQCKADKAALLEALKNLADSIGSNEEPVRMAYAYQLMAAIGKGAQ